jgi:23S rRNA (uracil1939-C5)-methyltransferase
LYNKAIEYAGLSGKETVFDLYCGIGTISLFLSERAKRVYGVEVVEDAISDAKKNSRIKRNLIIRFYGWRSGKGSAADLQDGG